MNRNRYRATAVALAIGTASMLGAASAFAQASEPVRIGVPTALSGVYASLGAEVKRAVDFAVAEVNAKGGIMGRKVEIKVLDTEVKPDVARKQAERLALEGYKILTGTIASGEGLAMAPMLERWDAIYVSTINKSNKLTGDSCVPRLFRVNHSDAQDAAVVRPWLATRKEGKWAIIAADIAWGRDSGKSFSDAVKATPGKQLVAEHYPALGSNDFAPFIQQIKASGAQGLWVALAGRDAINFANQAKQFGLLDSMFTAGVSFVTDGTVKTLGETAKGIWGIINYSSTLDTPDNKRFVEAWRKTYSGDEPTNFEGETYLGMQVIFQAVERAKSSKPLDVARVLRGGTFDTIMGKLTIRPQDHQLVSPNYIGYVGEQGGKLRPIIATAIDAAQATPAPSGDCKMGPL
ncbi:MAG: ABC transporter substrate-binding protein [Burkholderiaceae bacterium]|nr:ABC transporter substrate-binding protein [Burkholderiaceae bacterium]